MSTKERFGTLVWQALSGLFNAPNMTDDGWVTVGEVSSDTGMSKVTARKYLEELVVKGYAKRAIVGNAVGYRPQWGGQE